MYAKRITVFLPSNYAKQNTRHLKVSEQKAVLVSCLTMHLQETAFTGKYVLELINITTDLFPHNTE